MANKTFRRVLSVIMCAAMLVSVFAVSFSASAADDSSVVYEWDYTGSNGADDVEDTVKNSVITPSSLSLSYNNGGYAEFPANNHATTAVFNTPDGYTPYKFTLVSLNSLSGKPATAGPVVGNITYGTGESAVTKSCHLSLFATDNNWETLRCNIAIRDQARRDLKKGLKPVLTNQDGEYLTKDTNVLYNAFGLDEFNVKGGTDTATALLNKLSYVYDVSVDNDKATVVITIRYNADDGSTYETKTQPIEIDLAYLQSLASTITEFTPAFGIARDYDGNGFNSPTSKFASVKAEYTKACSHEHTHTVAGTAATCTEDGVNDSVFCDDCQRVISGGEVIKATGHTPNGEGVVTDPVCNRDGYITYVCAVCGEEYTVPGEKATGTHDKSKVVKKVEPTCTTEGYTVYECDNCGEQFEDDTVKALGHDYSDMMNHFKVTKVPTETEAGLEAWFCPRCDTHPDGQAEHTLPVVKIGVTQTQVVLDGNINLVITATANNYFTDSSLKLTIKNKATGEAKAYDKDNGLVAESNDGYYNTYKFVISNFAHQMTDKYDVTFEGVAEKSTINAPFDKAYTYSNVTEDISVASNLGHVFASANDVTKTLIAKLANYGTAAQKYDEAANGIAYEEYANDFLTAEEKETYKTNDAAFEEMADCMREGSFAIEGSKYFADVKGGLTLALQSKVSMVVKVAGVKLDEGQKLYVGTSTADAVEFTEDGDYLTATIGSFAPNQYKDTVKLRLFVKGSDGEFLETASGEVTYSVGAYIYKMHGATSSNEFADLLNAMSEYYTAAVEYNSQMS